MTSPHQKPPSVPATRRWMPCSVVAVAAVSLLLVASGCSGSDPGGASPSQLEGHAQALSWPDGHAPPVEALSAFAAAAGTTDEDAQTQVGWANTCAWYLAWYEQYRQGDVSPTLLAHLRDEVPQLTFVQGISAGPETFEALAADAEAMRPAAIEEFLRLNRCDTLDDRPAAS